MIKRQIPLTKIIIEFQRLNQRIVRNKTGLIAVVLAVESDFPAVHGQANPALSSHRFAR
jgi:hypothetical protein